ncbi:MAG: hypothetical protein OIN66_18185 [Candidatus Methanoperedens sp.]|nr:hypothetical protein [Candidatus Methanoperedens sp.]
MKNARFESLIEELSSEQPSPDYDFVFSRIMEIDSKVNQMSKKYGISERKIYEMTDAELRDIYSEFLNDPSAIDFHYHDTMGALEELESHRVPKKEHRNYGGKIAPVAAAMAVLMAGSPNDYIGRKPVTDVGEPGHREELPVRKAFDFIDYIIGGVRKHKTAVVVGIIGTLGLYAVGNSLIKAKKEHADDTDAGIDKAKAQIFGATGATILSNLSSNSDIVNESAKEEYHFSPDIKIHGSDVYKEKVQKALEEIKRVDIDEHNEVMLYLEVVRSGPDDTVGEGVVTILEKVLDAEGPYAFVHEKWHILEGVPPYESEFQGKGGWDRELNAVKKGLEWEAKVYNYSEKKKQLRFKELIEPFKDGYPKEYAELFPEKHGFEGELDKIKEEVGRYADRLKLTEEQKLQRFLLRIESLKGDYPKEYNEYISAGNFSDI